MSEAIKKLLKGKQFLLLQGPMGPFFNDMAYWLESLGREAVNVVFNGGDRFYCRKRKYLAFMQTEKEFSAWLNQVKRDYEFDTILCFGDCRTLHKVAKGWAHTQGVRFFVFEEGYLRPNFITLEEGGVNANSSLPRDAEFYRQLLAQPAAKIEACYPSKIRKMAHASWYYFISWYYRHTFDQYCHHKPFSPWREATYWFRAGWRKTLYQFKQRYILNRLTIELDQRYYLAILQVYNDSQIEHHSPYNDVRDYIREVMCSFAQHAPADTYLVIKHHPMDCGHRNYAALINELCKRLNIIDRVVYIHDLPLRELISHAQGVVTINSTAGILALMHGKRLKVMGEALYDIRGVTFQSGLDFFWRDQFTTDDYLFKNFMSHLTCQTQVNIHYYQWNVFSSKVWYELEDVQNFK